MLGLGRGDRDRAGLSTAVCAHACSCAAWHPHRSQAGTRRSGAPPCCRGSAGSVPCVGRTPPDPSCRCYRGTGRAGSAPRAAAGPRSTRAHTRRSGDLRAQSVGQRLGMGTGTPSVPRRAPTCVPGAAVADDLPGAPVLVARGGEVPGAAGPLGAGAGPAVLAGAQRRVPEVPVGTPGGWAISRGRGCRSTQPLPGRLPAHLWHLSPSVWSRQRRQLPVRGSQSSACPLHWQGRHAGKPQWPGWQRSQREPWAPSRQGHCPVVLSHTVLTEPSLLHWQAARHPRVCPQQPARREPPPRTPSSAG